MKKSSHNICTVGREKKLQLFGTVVCFKILFHFHILNSLNSEQIKVLHIIPQKKKKKKKDKKHKLITI